MHSIVRGTGTPSSVCRSIFVFVYYESIKRELNDNLIICDDPYIFFSPLFPFESAGTLGAVVAVALLRVRAPIIRACL